MDAKSVLSREELEALLGGATQADIVAGNGAGQGSAAASDMRKLIHTLLALTARVDYLERQVKDLRMQALAQEEQLQALQRLLPAAEEGAPRQEPTGDNGTDNGERPGTRLSRMERYGKPGSRRLF